MSLYKDSFGNKMKQLQLALKQWSLSKVVFIEVSKITRFVAFLTFKIFPCISLNIFFRRPVRFQSINNLFSIYSYLQDSLRGVYLTSTISEWLLAISVLTYTLTYTWDFKSMILESPKVTLDFDRLEQVRHTF